MTFYRVSELETLLGISEDWLRRAIAAGRLPSHRFGRAIRISSDDLEVFLKSRRFLPAASTVNFRRTDAASLTRARQLRDMARGR